MDVAAYHPWIYLKGGVERTLLEVLRRSEHRWTLYTNRYDADQTFPEFRGHRVVELPRVSVRRTVVHAGRAVATLLSQAVDFGSARALMVSSEGFGNLIAMRTRHIPVFCLCFTPLRVAYDLAYRERYFTARPSKITRAAVAAYVELDRMAWNHYRRVFCISREVANRMERAYLVPPDRLEILHPGVDDSWFVPRSTCEPLFLLPGRIMWTKNIELGLDAFVRLKETVPAAARHGLVVAGMVDEKSRPYLAALRARVADRPDIEFILNPSDTELRTLYSRCLAVLFTAFNEDWGLVPLEAMAAGRPVVAVARGGPLETIVDGVTGYLRPPETDVFAKIMAELVADPDMAASLGATGQERARQFRWGTFVNRIDRYVEHLAAQSQVQTDWDIVPATVEDWAVGATRARF